MEQLKYSEKAAIPFSSFLHAEKGMDSSEQLQQPKADILEHRRRPSH